MLLISRIESQPPAEAPPPDPAEEERVRLRAKHGVRPVTAQEEGYGIHRLPGGVYGFTYSPGVAEAPLFTERKYQCFEVHKLPDETVVLVGYVSDEMARRIETDAGELKLMLQPAPREGEAALIGVPVWRVRRHKEHSYRDGQGLELELGPLH